LQSIYLLWQDILVLGKTWWPPIYPYDWVIWASPQIHFSDSQKSALSFPTWALWMLPVSPHRYLGERITHDREPWGNSMHGDASCAIPQSWNPSPPSLSCSSAIHTLFSPSAI